MPHNSHFPTFFLVDDALAIRQRVASMLTACGMGLVGEAETPEAAIDGILQAQPDVVLLDIQLRGGTGLEVLRAVHRAAPGIAFVVFSNSAGPAYRKRYLAAGAAAFLDKSTELDRLAQTVSSVTQGNHHVH
ncbi:MAG: response regulator transcription factor [Ramlibacter sp.]